MTLSKTTMMAAVAAVSISTASMAADNQSQLYNYNEQGVLNSEDVNGSVTAESETYSNVAPAAGAPAISTTATSMAKTQAIALNTDIIEEAQSSLQKAGYAVSADGVWGPKTASAVQDFQKENGLATTGRLDAQTLAALDVRR